MTPNNLFASYERIAAKILINCPMNLTNPKAQQTHDDLFTIANALNEYVHMKLKEKEKSDA